MFRGGVFAECAGTHPMRRFYEPLALAGPLPARRTFIASTVDPIGINDAEQEAARTSPDWCYHEIATNHDAMLTSLHEMARILDPPDNGLKPHWATSLGIADLRVVAAQVDPARHG